MKRIFLITTLTLLFGTLVFSESRAQSQPAVSDYTGTEYYISIPPSDPKAASRSVRLVIASEFATTGWIEIPEVPVSDLEEIEDFQTVPFAVRNGEAYIQDLSRLLEPKFNDEASLRTVRLVSRAPVSVTVINAGTGSSGAYPVLPVQLWGTEYYPTALPEVAPKLVGITSQILLTAMEDETNVTIRPTARTTFYKIGQLANITLNKGETYLIQADTLIEAEGMRDLSGTNISSNKPIGVVAGHVRAALSGNPDVYHSNQQFAAWHATMQLPTDDWGTRYYTVPMRSEGDRFRLMAQQSNTTVRATFYDDNGNPLQQKEFTLRWPKQALDVYAPDGANINMPVKWESDDPDHPFTVTQLRLTNGTFGDMKNSPAMLGTVPTSLYSAHSVFGLPAMLNGQPFTMFDLQLIATGDGSNPFENITIDGTPATDFDGVETLPIDGTTWRLKAQIAPGGHNISATGNVRFTGHVSGDNGISGGIALAWELPHWSADIERDLTAPVVADWSEFGQGNNRGVNVMISDRTDSYFSGIETVEAYNSPGWTQEPFFAPIDRDQDATTRFAVKNGVDPSGPLSLLLRDYDGNERVVKVFNGICNKTAYLDPASDTITLIVKGTESVKAAVRIEANPCGDQAELTWARYDENSPASDYLEDPLIADNQPIPYTIASNGTLEIYIRTKPELIEGNYTQSTTLDLIIDGNTYKVPVIIQVDNVTSVPGEEEGLATFTASPNPTTGDAVLMLSSPLSRFGMVEISDARGRVVRIFDGTDHAGMDRILWDGMTANGEELPPGVYFMTLHDGEKTATGRIIRLR